MSELEVRDSRGKLIEHVADIEEDYEPSCGTSLAEQFTGNQTSDRALSTPRGSPAGRIHPDVEIIERGPRSSSASGLSPGLVHRPGSASKIELQEVRGEPVKMSKDVFKLLEELEEHIQGCRRVPMTDKVLVGEDALLDYIDQIRALLPEEVRQARLMVKDREQLIEDARVDVERIMAEANKRIEGLIRESEVVKRAEEAAEEIVAQSRRVAYEIKNNATRYADDIMSNLETNLEQNLTIIRSGREELSQLKRDRQSAANG